jgi:hypothetical protein
MMNFNELLPPRTRTVAMLAGLFVVALGTAWAQINPGDPLFCQPNEGNTFLIVNGGTGIFTVDSDCYNNNITLSPPPSTITTTQGGTLTLHIVSGEGNYTYTPPTPTFTGTDTFTIPVTTSWNSTGGTGSNGGACLARSGCAQTETVTLNVLPSTYTLAASAGTPAAVPIPAGSVSGCSASQGSSANGPPPGTINGCTTAIGLGPFGIPSLIVTAHGRVTTNGTALTYTANAGYNGPDTFQIQIFGVNTDGINALNSGFATVNVTVTAPATVPTLGYWGLVLLAGLLVLFGIRMMRRRTA